MRGTNGDPGVIGGGGDRTLRAFMQTQELAPADRGIALAQIEGSDPTLAVALRSLFRHSEAPATLLRSASGINELVAAARGLETDSAWSPEWIGPYRVLRRVGRGASSTVFEAEQPSPRRRVAVKVLRPDRLSEAALRRFAQEGAAMARLDHPGIARIFEAGVDEGADPPLPYLVMELIDGEPLTAYAATGSGGALGREQRVELLATVADAVHHAHARGVIHRDLKPANILVDKSGRPRVLDFDVARLMAHDPQVEPPAGPPTLTGDVIGTVAYMSPEQAAGDPARVDARADVYALGVILYELLAGRRPLQIDALPITEAVRAVLETEPPRLGTVAPALGGDLDTIVHTAMDKCSHRRYASAADLASDLRAWLRGEPIAAAPPTIARRLARWGARRRPLLWRAAVLLPTLGILATSVLLFRAREATGQARIEAAVSDSVARAGVGDRTRTFAEVLVSFREGVHKAGGGDPLWDIRALTLLGKRLTGADRLADAQQALSAAVDLAAGLAPLDVDRLHCTVALARVLVQRGSAAQARALCRRVLDTPGSLGMPPVRLSQLYKLLGDCDDLDGRHEDAIGSYRAALRVAAASLGASDSTTLIARDALAATLAEQGRLAEAAALAAEDGIALLSPRGRPAEAAPESTLRLARYLLGRGNAVAAEPLARAVVAGAPMGDSRAEALGVLGGALWLQGRHAEAAAVFQEVAQLAERLFGAADHRVADAINSLGVCLRDLGDFPAAETALRRAMALRCFAHGSEHASVLDSQIALSRLLVSTGRYVEALSLAQTALARRAPGVRPDLSAQSPGQPEPGPGAIEPLALVGMAYAGMGDCANAALFLRLATDLRRGLWAQADWKSDLAVHARDGLLRAGGRSADADSLLVTDYREVAAFLGPAHPATQRALGRLAAAR
jgi:tetratricopeptide (TPR) repeat protein/tRNA A-37 threonylcarbamoyl transferase component Bud32